MKKICRLGLVFILLFTLVLSNISFSNYVYALEDVSDSLTILSKSVYQGGKLVNVGEKIDTTKPFTVAFEIKVPVKGDNPVPAKYVKHGDFANIEFGEGITIQGTGEQKFKTNDGIEQATAKFSNEANGKAKVNIKFDGDPHIYSGQADNKGVIWRNVKMKMSATFNVDTSKAKNPDGSYEVKVFGLVYKTVTPITVKALTKKGDVDVKDQTVQWTVKFKTDGGDVKGFKFLDELKDIGPYVNGTFKVNDTNVNPEYNANKELRYTFTQQTNDVTVEFKTQLTPIEFRSKDTKLKKINKVQILNAQDVSLSSATGEPQWSPVWISKGHENIKQEAGSEATWVIEFNRAEKATLKNVVIEDVLKKSILTERKQDFVSATIEKFDGTTYGAPTTIVPTQTLDNGNQRLKFNVGDIDNGIKIKIKVKIDENLDMTVGNRFQNLVYAGWEGVGVDGKGDFRASASSAFNIGNYKFFKGSESKN